MKRWWSVLLQVFLLIIVRVKRKAPIPNSPFIICANHTSYLDIILLPAVVHKFFVFMGKQELLKYPLIKVFFKNGLFDIPVWRENKMAAARSLQKAAFAIDNGYSVAIFPEGRIIEEKIPKLLRFKNGAFKLAIEKQVPIVPITYLNNWKLLSDPFLVFKRAHPGISKIVVHEPVNTKGMTDKDLVYLRQKVFDIINNELLKYQNEG